MRNKTRLLSGLLIAILVLGGLPVFVLAQDTATSLTPATQTIAPSAETTVTLHVADVTGLYGYQANLTFDPAVLEVVDADIVAPGLQVELLATFLQPEMIVTNVADNSAGTIMCTVMQVTPTLPVDGSGDLLSITFRAKIVGNSAISFTSLNLFDQNGAPITTTLTAAQIQVSDATPTPEPTATTEPTPEPTTTPPTEMGTLLKGMAVDPFRNLLYVAVQSDNTVAIVDGATHTLVNKVPAGGSAPNSLALSQDGSKLFVANGGSDNVAVLDANNNYALLGHVAAGRKPFGLAVVGNTGYVTNFEDGTVTLFDATTFGVIETFWVGFHPALPAAVADRIYVPVHSAFRGWQSKDPQAERTYVQQNKGTDTGVAVVYNDGRENPVLHILQEYIGFYAIAIDEAHGRVYITKRDGTAEGLYVLDLNNHQLIQFVPMLRPYAVAVNTETQHVFVVQGDMDEVYVLDATNGYRLIRAVNTDPNNGNIAGMHGGQGIAVNGNDVVVANLAAGTLTAFDDASPGSNLVPPIDVEYIRGWQEAGGNHGYLGAPTAAGFAYWYSEQQYERGSMHFRQVPTGTNQIYVFDNQSTQVGGTDWAGRDSGVWSQQDDGWTPGMPLFPAGCSEAWWPYGPMFGFGVTWCDQAGVKDTIGYPIGWEFGTLGGDQKFANGVIFWNPAVDAYYVLRNDDHTWRYIRAHRRYDATLKPNVVGQINLQGRKNAQGVQLTSLAGVHTATDASGSFGLHFVGQTDLYIRHTGYLDIVATVKASDNANLNLGAIQMIGGDVNDDNRIDILDLSFVGSNLGAYAAAADVNGDGAVDILDLSLVGSNFGRSGPVHWQR